jgi:hypothetical protein
MSILNLPQYKCHKVVGAVKITSITRSPNRGPDGSALFMVFSESEGHTPVVVGQEYIDKHSPFFGGYLVEYADGYLSFSPAEAFEEGYSPHINPFRGG